MEQEPAYSNIHLSSQTPKFILWGLVGLKGVHLHLFLSLIYPFLNKKKREKIQFSFKKFFFGKGRRKKVKRNLHPTLLLG
jgi:hypothetical protein